MALGVGTVRPVGGRSNQRKSGFRHRMKMLDEHRPAVRSYRDTHSPRSSPRFRAELRPAARGQRMRFQPPGRLVPGVAFGRWLLRLEPLELCVELLGGPATSPNVRRALLSDGTRGAASGRLRRSGWGWRRCCAHRLADHPTRAGGLYGGFHRRAGLAPSDRPAMRPPARHCRIDARRLFAWFGASHADQTLGFRLRNGALDRADRAPMLFGELAPERPALPK